MVRDCLGTLCLQRIRDDFTVLTFVKSTHCRTQATSLQCLIPSHNHDKNKTPTLGCLILMADGEGFEPPDELPRQRFSRPSHSTALPTILNFFFLRQGFQTGYSARLYLIASFRHYRLKASIVYILTRQKSMCFSYYLSLLNKKTFRGGL